MTEITGFVGIEKYDLILYLSTILSKMGHKVLIIDNSETDALTCCIPIPSAINPKISKATFGKIDFVKDNNHQKYINDYEYIFVDFGLKTTQKDIEHCSKLFIVTDKQQHTIDKINKIRTSLPDVFLILKDLNWRDKVEKITQSIVVPVKETFSINNDEVDRALMIGLQYEERIVIKKLSQEYRDVIQTIITNVFNKDTKEYGTVYKMLKRGA